MVQKILPLKWNECVKNPTLLVFIKGSLRSGSEILKLQTQRGALCWCFLYPQWSNIGKYNLLQALKCRQKLHLLSTYPLLLSDLREGAWRDARLGISNLIFLGCPCFKEGSDPLKGYPENWISYSRYLRPGQSTLPPCHTTFKMSVSDTSQHRQKYHDLIDEHDE